LYGFLRGEPGRKLADAANYRNDNALTERLGKLDFFQGGNVTALNILRQTRSQWVIVFPRGSAPPTDGDHRNDKDQ
jgi:hypothetical protein